MNKKILIIAAISMVLIVSLKYFSSSDRQEIAKIIDQLEQSLEYQKTLPPLAVLSRLKKVKAHLAPNFSAESIDEKRQKQRSLDNAESIKGVAVMAARHFSMIDILKLPSIIKVDGKRASTSFKITIDGMDKYNVSFKELFDIAIKFIKIEDKWYCLAIKAERITPED